MQTMMVHSMDSTVVDFKWLPNHRGNRQVLILVWKNKDEYIAQKLEYDRLTGLPQVVDELCMSQAAEFFPEIADLLRPQGTAGSIDLF